MALVFDATARGESSNSTTITYSHVNAGDILVAGVSYRKANGTTTAIGSVTYNSVAMTLVPSSFGDFAFDHHTALYYLIAPSVGTFNVVVNFVGNDEPFDAGSGSVSFTGAHQTSPLGTAAVAGGTSTTPSVNVSSASGEIVIDNLIIVHSGTLTVGANQTQRWNDIAPSGFIKYAGSTEPGVSTTTMSWSNSSSQGWIISAVPIKPAAEAGSFQSAWARNSNQLIRTY